MNSMQTIRDKSHIIKTLLHSKKTNGEQYTYAEILDIIGIENNATNRRNVSQLALENGIRRRVVYTIKKDKTTEEVQSPDDHDVATGVIPFVEDNAQELSLTITRDKLVKAFNAFIDALL